MAQLFEDLDNDKNYQDTDKPFFAINRDDDKTLLDWLTGTVTKLKQLNETRLQKAKNNYARYKGIQYREQVYQPRDLPEKRIRYMPQMVVPLVADVIDEKVARLHEYKAGVQIIPQDDETQDKADVKIAKRFIKHVDQQENLDTRFRKATKSSKIAGESFILVLWNNDKGAEILKAGEVAQGPDGKIVKGPLYEGDLEVRNVTTLEVLYEKAKTWENVDYLFYFDYEYTEKLKREYPEKAEQIKPNIATTYYDFETMDMKDLQGQSSVIWFWHRHTKYLPAGYECKFSADVILKKGDLPYDHGKLPVKRWIDIENEQELSGESGIDKTKAMSSQFNNLMNMAIKQINLGAHPHWFIEGGAVDDQALGNDFTIVKVKQGMKAPVLAQSNPVSPQVFEFMQSIKDLYYQMAKSNSIVQGEPPPGVTAFVALQFVSESENRRISNDSASVNESMRQTYEMILQVAGQFYKPTDKRTMMILGKDNRWTIAKYNPKSLRGPYSIIMQNSSALPDSKALRTQFILDMAKQFPGMFPESQIAEMLDLGQSEKFLDVASLAAKAAEDENEYILDGGKQIDPQMHEDLITHWKVHVSSIQDIGFKTQATPEVQKNMREHILATEFLMWQMANRSSAYMNLINVMCPQFPIYFTVPKMPSPEALGIPQPPPQDAAPGSGKVAGAKSQPGDPGFQGSKRPDETKVGGPSKGGVPY